MKTRILHLSDIHIGTTPKSNTDDKTGILSRHNKQPDPLSVLKTRLKQLKPFHYVVISGDIGSNGNTENTVDFRKMVENLIELNIFPSQSNIIIVPGNHDVTGTSIEDTSSKTDNFYKNIPIGCIVPWENPQNHDIETMTKNVHSIITSKPTRVRMPFLIDPNRKVIFYALNSCPLCQCTTKDNETVDLPRIDDSELELMKNVFAELRKNLGNAEYEQYLTICVMHHHLTAIASFEECKNFEMVTNAGKIKKLFAQCGIKLFLHGHKHWPEIYFDMSITDGGGFVAISGGTICATSNREGKGSGFFVIDYDDNDNWLVEGQYHTLDESSKDGFHKKISLQQPSPFFSMCSNISILYEEIGNFLTKHMIIDEEVDGSVSKEIRSGWDKLVLIKDHVGVMGSAIGLVISAKIDLCNITFQKERNKIISSLFKRRETTGGFCAYFSKLTSFEATCWVALAMKFSGEWNKYFTITQDLLKMLEESNKNKLGTFTVSFLLSVFVDAYRRTEDERYASAAKELKSILMESICGDKYSYWKYPNSNDESAIHSAHAIIRLLEYYQYINKDKDILDIKPKIRLFLLQSEQWDDKTERIRINKDEISYEHYTLPWRIIALLKLGVPKHNSVMQDAIGKLIKTYQNGIQPRNRENIKIWEISDTITALETYLHSEIIN